MNKILHKLTLPLSLSNVTNSCSLRFFTTASVFVVILSWNFNDLTNIWQDLNTQIKLQVSLEKDQQNTCIFLCHSWYIQGPLDFWGRLSNYFCLQVSFIFNMDVLCIVSTFTAKLYLSYFICVDLLNIASCWILSLSNSFYLKEWRL